MVFIPHDDAKAFDPQRKKTPTIIHPQSCTTSETNMYSNMPCDVSISTPISSNSSKTTYYITCFLKLNTPHSFKRISNTIYFDTQQLQCIPEKNNISAKVNIVCTIDDHLQGVMYIPPTYTIANLFLTVNLLCNRGNKPLICYIANKDKITFIYPGNVSISKARTWKRFSNGETPGTPTFVFQQAPHYGDNMAKLVDFGLFAQNNDVILNPFRNPAYTAMDEIILPQQKYIYNNPWISPTAPLNIHNWFERIMKPALLQI